MGVFEGIAMLMLCFILEEHALNRLPKTKNDLVGEVTRQNQFHYQK